MSLLQWATELMKNPVPFVPRGRTREGLDCWGVVWLGYKENYNKILPSCTDEYDPEDMRDFEKLANIIGQHSSGWVEVKKAEEGDVVLMRLRNRPIHVGLVLCDGLMIHIEQGIELCVEKYGNSIWKNRIVGVYRYCPV